MPKEDALRVASLHNCLEEIFHKLTTLEKVHAVFTTDNVLCVLTMVFKVSLCFTYRLNTILTLGINHTYQLSCIVHTDFPSNVPHL